MSVRGDERSRSASQQLHTLPTPLHAAAAGAEEDEDEYDEHDQHAEARALSPVAAQGSGRLSASAGSNAAAAASDRAASASSAASGATRDADSVHIHVQTSYDNAVDHGTNELSPSLGKNFSRSDGPRGSSMELASVEPVFTSSGEHDDEKGSLGLPGKRSSMIAGTASSLYDSSGHGGGDEELEHVLPSQKFFARLEKLLNHFAWNLCILLLIGGDVVLIIFKLGLAQTSPVLNALTLILVGLFLAEVAARIVAFGRTFFKNVWFVVYSLCTLATFLFLLDAFQIRTQQRDIVAIVLQCVSAFLRFGAAGCELAPAARAMVRGNKARYQQHGFDLDLTYITDRVIAMGLPSTKIEAVYRNPIDEVARFFNTQHKDHYLIINLCSEREYPVEKFHGRVARFPFDDHNPAPLSTMLQFCVYVQDFLQQDKDNVVAVHCKGGKGRTGSMVVAWLLFSKPDMYAEQALKMFATFRTAQDLGGKLQGVSGPSQKRYIGYFEQLRFVAQDQDKKGGENEKRAKLLRDEKARDVHNSSWNQSKNWSLLITHYAPIHTVSGLKKDEGASSSASSRQPQEEHEDPEHWTAETINRRNQARYADTKEFFFPAREKEMTSDDDSITFDISSFHSAAKSLILTGDLKFQVFRGNLSIEAAEKGVRRSAGSPSANEEDDEDGAVPASSAGSAKSDVVEKPSVYCWFWIHTAFISGASTRLVLRKEQIDEVAKDKNVDPEMNLALDYFSPPRAESWTHAPHPTFHIVPDRMPLSPRTPKKTPEQLRQEAEEEAAEARHLEDD